MVGGSAAVDSSSDTGSGNVDRGLAKDRDSSPRVKKVETGRHAETRSPNAELESKKKGWAMAEPTMVSLALCFGNSANDFPLHERLVITRQESTDSLKDDEVIQSQVTMSAISREQTNQEHLTEPQSLVYRIV